MIVDQAAISESLELESLVFGGVVPQTNGRY